jgi:hypothetical protein
LDISMRKLSCNDILVEIIEIVITVGNLSGFTILSPRMDKLYFNFL